MFLYRTIMMFFRMRTDSFQAFFEGRIIYIGYDIINFIEPYIQSHEGR